MQDQQSKLDAVRCEVAWDKTTQSTYENTLILLEQYKSVAHEHLVKLPQPDIFKT